ncbi:MAG: nucleoside hydrolase [Oscillospiraceae bacterium]
MSRIPFVLDTDPGIDDAMALMLLASSDKLDIKAVTAVAGNVGIEHTATNALNLVELFKLDNTIVAKGAVKPMIVSQEKAENVHGINGLRGIQLKESKREFSKDEAWDVIYKQAVEAKGKLHLCAIGPLTNIAIALQKYPDLVSLIDKMTIMGGAATWGNHSEYGEFNIWGDPHAADIVFKSGLEIAMIDLDIIAKCYLTDDELEELRLIGNNVSHFINDLFAVFREYESHKKDREMKHCVCDCVAAAYVLKPEIFTSKKYYVAVETQSKDTAGQTIVDFHNTWGKKPNTIVFSDVDREEYKNLLKEMMHYYKNV